MRLRTVASLALPLASILLLGAGDAPPAGQLVDNPPYRQWSAFNVGASVTLVEKVEGNSDLPGIVDATAQPPGPQEYRITDTLVQFTPQRAVIQETVTRVGRNSFTELAPAKLIYPAKVKAEQAASTPKSEMVSLNEGDEEMDVAGKKLKVHWVATVIKGGSEVSTSKEWLSDDVPGGLVKQITSKAEGDKVLIKSSMTVLSFKRG